MTENLSENNLCKCCGNAPIEKQWDGYSLDEVTSGAFAVTDAHYGATFPVYRCTGCGFLQCPVDDPVRFYESLEDDEYEEGRSERSRQARKLLNWAGRRVKPGRLLDVGAATGMLVAEAQKLGWDTEGVEPSQSFAEIAQKHGLPVKQGVLPHPDLAGPYDMVTLIDVIEHVTEPYDLLCQISDVLEPGGMLMLATPDVESFMAKRMGRKWWHFRLAHIGYFSVKTLTGILERAGYELVATSRPVWYFNMRYLAERMLRYVPRALRGSPPKWMNQVLVPLNLFDSVLFLCRKKGDVDA